MQELIQSVITPLTKKSKSIHVGITLEGKHSYQGFGSLSENNKNPPDLYTLFETGDIGKTVTAALLAKTIREGKAPYHEPISSFGWEFTNLPDEITPYTLVTHTSGMPFMPTNIKRYLLRNYKNPHHYYNDEDWIVYLRKYKTKQKSKVDDLHYSHTGYAVLGRFLERIWEEPFEILAKKLVMAPLGLEDTTLTFPAEKLKRIAPPYNYQLKKTHLDRPSTFQGAGGWISSTADLLYYLEAHLSPSPAFAYFADTHGIKEKGRKGIKGAEGVSRGWMIVFPFGEKYPVHFISGSTAGSQCFIGWCKPAHAGIVICSNKGAKRKETPTRTEISAAGLAIIREVVQERLKERGIFRTPELPASFNI
ncbi:serine hydrolase [Thalassobacillus sp. C254]|uniref:serine hydrolase domain-containing protein n=1 Tax=Thalassobacillus sp. C254 TaxID=1225341 RepID=UPI0006D005DE|nr:serine hydrolase [Thalassobacillus sp. C254]